MVRVGIVGFGFMGQTHFRCYEKLNPSAKVVAVADINPARAAGDTTGTWGNMGGGPTQIDFSNIFGTQDYRDLLNRNNIDLIDVCVPTPSHASIVLDALQANKHVLCEKPLARTMEQTIAIFEAAEKANSFLMPAMCIRFWPQWYWLKDVVAEERYGKVLGASFTRQATAPPGWLADGKQSGGALLDLHIHDTDFVCHLFGKPKAVSSRGYPLQTGAIDHVVTHYVYDDIPLVIAEGCWAFFPPFPFRMRYTVNFESGATADFDLARADPLVVHQNGVTTSIACEAIDGWMGEIRYLLECITSGTRPTRVTALDALTAFQVVDAERRSIETGEIQRL